MGGEGMNLRRRGDRHSWAVVGMLLVVEVEVSRRWRQRARRAMLDSLLVVGRRRRHLILRFLVRLLNFEFETSWFIILTTCVCLWSWGEELGDALGGLLLFLGLILSLSISAAPYGSGSRCRLYCRPWWFWFLCFWWRAGSMEVDGDSWRYFNNVFEIQKGLFYLTTYLK